MSLADWRALGLKKGKQIRHPAVGRRLGLRTGLTCEALEERRVLAVSLAPIPGPDSGVFSVPSGKDLYVPLTSIDLGNTVTYTATSSNPNVTVQILNGNPTLQLNVTGTDNTGTAFSGVLTIQLFEDLAPETVAQISSLVNTGFYNGLTFYRIVPDFVIQGGANGTKTAPTFDDEFNVNLSFNSPGLLAMANPGTANSNTSEVFITDIDEPLNDLPLYLNFRHSIFGQLTSGFDTYLKIMDAQGTSSTDSSPSSPITITSASIITDTQNGVVRISEDDGFAGTSTITITAHSSDGTTTDTETFTINAAPLTQVSSNHPLLLNAVADQTTTVGQAVSFQISANQLFGGTLGFSVSGTNSFNATPSNVTVTVSNVTATSATITLTPAAGFAGTINLVAHVDDNGNALHDAHEFTLTVLGSLNISSVTNPINAANDNSVSISGNSGVGNTISVVASDGTTTTAAQTVTVGNNGLWTINNFDVTALADGTITFTATDLTAGGTDTITATKDSVFPALQITSVTSPIGAGNKNAVVITGTGEAGRTVTLQIAQGQTTNNSHSTTVDSNGNWTITGIDLSAFSNGIVSFTASSADAAGNNAQTSTTSTIDTVAPTVDITTVTDPVSLGNATNTSASGTGEVGATISLVVTDGTNTTTTYTTTVAAGGTWSITGIDVSDLLDGTITYRATASDQAGNTAVDTQTATKSAVAITTITSPINASNDDNTSVSGTGQSGAEISLVVTDGTNSTTTYTTTVAANGTWTITGVDVSALDDGQITYNVTATFEEETAVHSKTVTKDTVGPAVDVVSVSDPINAGNAAATFVNGSSEAGVTVSVVASDGTNTTSAVTATANSTGTWSVTGINVASLADGTITYTITVTDAAGNSTVTTRTSVKDTVAPTIDITSGTTPITIANSDNITVSGTGEPGATVSVVVSDGTNSTAAVTTTVGENGTWTVSGIDVSNLADGAITYTATITDAAHNTATDTQSATKSTIDITVVTDPINISNVSNVTVSGTGEVGASVSVVATDGTHTTTAVTTTIGANGTWSISGINLSALTDGTITFTATATDDEENSAQATITATKDTVAPVLTIGSVTDPVNNATAVVVSGTGQVGALVIVTVTDGTHTTTSHSVTVAADGTWQISNIDVTALNEGTVTVNATSSDGAGNSSQASKTATKSAAATASLTGRVYIDSNGNGSFDENEGGVGGVILTLHGTDAQGNAIASRTTTSGANGVYTFSSLPAGTYSITMSRPTKFSAGTSTAGSLGGTAGTLSTTGIAVATGNAGTGYNFGIGQLDESMISARLLLASTPPLSELFAGIVNQYGIAAPVAMSIVKADADPTTSATLRFTITFNEDVTGVDTGDFAIVGNATASIASVTGSGKTYTVTVNRNGATGNIGLKLVDNDTIASAAASVKLAGTGTGNGNFVGPSYSTSNASTSVDVTTVTDPINNSNKSNVTASGTGEAGATISLVVTDGTNSTSAHTTTVASNGTWSITGINVSALNDGTLTFNVTATKTGGGTATDSKTAVKDTVAPAVAVTTVTDPVNASNDENASASGTGEAGATISLVVTDGTHSTSALTTTVASNGTWSITGINLSSLSDGTITFNVTATDAAGNTATSSKTASKDTVAPTVNLEDVTDPITIANHHDTDASGTGEVGATISLVVTNGTTTSTTYTTTVGANGTWTINDIDTAPVADGTVTYTVTATDAAGNTTTDTLTATKTTVAIVSITTPINAESQDNITVSGTGEVGATVTLVVSDGTNSTSVRTTTVGEDGTWSIAELDVSDLDDGTITFNATATDSEENTAQTTKTAEKDTVAPAVDVTTVTNPINFVNADNVGISGTGEAGATIKVIATDGTNSSTEYTTTVAANGTWSISDIDVTDLDDGTVTFNVTATDAAGNPATDSITATKDTVGPGVTITGLTEGITIANHKSLAISGTGEAGADISLVVTDGTHSTQEYTTTVDENGDWTITGIDTSSLDDGELTFNVTATDEIGNPSEASITADKSTVDAIEVTDPINAENADSVTISGTGQAGATITVIATDGTNSTTEYTTTIDENGEWSISGIDVSSLDDGTITFNVTATDDNENTAEDSITAVKDAAVPAVSITSVTDPIGADDAAAVTVSGTGEAGATITLVASDGTNSTTEYTTTVGEDGTWTTDDVDVSMLDDGEITFTATATDTAGNSATDTDTATLDTTAPAVEITSAPESIDIAGADSVTVSGTGEAGATISLVASDGTNSTAALTATVGEDGTWSITGIDVRTLADGTITFTATATDAAGNTATDTQTSSKTTVAITSVTDPINADNADSVTVSGTGQVGASISLVASDGTNSTAPLTTTVGEDGTWSITGVDVSTLDDGTITFTATATDDATNAATDTATAAKDTVAPAVAITEGTQQINAANATAAVAVGTGEAGAGISLVVSDGTTSTIAYTATVGEDGTWTIAGIDVSGLDDGTLTVTVTATDAAGNSATDTEIATLDTTAPAVDITNILDPITIANHHATSIGGTGEAGASISVVVSDGTHSTTAVTTTVAGDGTWSVTGIDTASLDDGVLTYTVTATDAAGNTATDTLTSTKLTVAITSVSDPINADNDDNVTVSGTGEVGAEISLVVTDGTDATTTYTTTIGQDGAWSITGVDVSALDDGTLTFTATATDENENTAQTTFTAEKDTVAPAVALSTVTDPIDDDNETTATASGTGEAGAAISLVASDGTTTINALVTAVSLDGTWSIIDIDVSGLDDGTITFTVTATDSFGNAADASKTASKSTSTAPLVDMVMGEEDDWT